MDLFVSDLHLDSPDSPQFETFAAFLAAEAPRASTIYILGDLCEVWLGDDDDGPLATALQQVLGDASSQCRIAVMHGNRDFLLGEQFRRVTGCELLPDPHLLGDGTLLAHGDALCVDDVEYQKMRAITRSPDWQREMLDKPLAVRRQLAADLRRRSHTANAYKAENIMDVSPAEVDRVMAGHRAVKLVHGHTHRPGVHQHARGTRVVLGAWERCGWLFRSAPAGSQLECFALTGRYET